MTSTGSSDSWEDFSANQLFRPVGQKRENAIGLGVVSQSDLSSTIIVSRYYNDLNFFLRLTACSTKRPYLTVIVG